MPSVVGGDLFLNAATAGGALLHGGEEFNYVELLLQLCCRTSRIRLLHAWRLASPQALHDFQKRTQDRLIVETFIDAATLDEENTLQEIARRGVKISSSGLRITLGNFSLPGFPLLSRNTKSSSGSSDALHLPLTLDPQKREDELLRMEETGRDMLSGERRLFEFLFCEVGVGRSLVLETAAEATGGRFTLPCEFDSVYVEKPAEAAPEESVTVHYCSLRDLPAAAMSVVEEQERQVQQGGGGRTAAAPHEEDKVLAPGVLPQYTFRHEYVVYDSSQILAKYFIVFEMDPCGEELFTVPLCDNCRERPACIWCASDAARLCVSCDRGIHGQNKLVSRHIRVPLNEMPRRPGICRLHPAAVYKWYCTCCDIPICRFCCPNHEHADAAFSSQKEKQQMLLPLTQPYRAALQLTERPHFILQARRQELRRRLQAVQRILTDVRGNVRSVEEGCFTLLGNAMTSLQRQTEEKMAAVAARQRELQRQLDFFAWGESFLNYQRRVLPPADLLAAWLRHCRLREELHKLSIETDSPEGAAARLIFADLRLEGHVCILTDSAVRRREAAQRRLQQKGLQLPLPQTNEPPPAVSLVPDSARTTHKGAGATASACVSSVSN